MSFLTRALAACLLIAVVLLPYGGSVSAKPDVRGSSDFIEIANMTSGQCNNYQGGPNALGVLMMYASTVDQTYEVRVTHSLVSGTGSGARRPAPPGFFWAPVSTNGDTLNVPWEMNVVVDGYINGVRVTHSTGVIGCRGVNQYYQTRLTFTRVLPVITLP